MHWRSTRPGSRRPRRGCSTFAALARKHRVEPDALAALGDEMRAQLAAIEAGGERIAELEPELAEARADYAAAAERLSAQRHEAAARLDEAVAGELAPLKLDAARFRTAIGAGRARPGGHRPRRVRSVDQPRRAVRAADPDRLAAASCRASSSR